jgi:hypothetical protein
MAKKVVIAGNAAVKTINTGSQTVGLSVVQLSTNSRNLTDGVQIVADAGNSNSVWVGVRSNLTAGGANSGVEIVAGAGLLVPVTSEDKVYLISDAGSQSVTFMSY